MKGIYNRTDPSPTTGESGAKINRSSTGKRPRESTCETLDACPLCAADRPFQFPVVPGDLVYFQFNFADHYNVPATNPTAGWYVDPSTDFWLEASLEFSSIPELGLPHGNIITSQSVGYEQGSYQNIFLNSNAIHGYVQTQGGSDTECFRLRVQTYRWVYEDVTQVISIGSVLPDPTGIKNDLLAIQGTDIYISEDGAWVFLRPAEDGELVFNTASGKYYEYVEGASKPWVTGERSREREAYQTCYSYWHKLVDSCTETILIQGIFQDKDCAGHYFGSFGGALPFQDQYRLEASFEMNAIVTEKETNENDVVIHLRQYENFVLRNKVNLPEGVIRRLANSLEAEHLYINSNEYVNSSDVAKLNESGEYWFVNITVQRLSCERTSDCDDEFVFNPIVNCPEFQPCPDPGSPVRVHNSDDTFDEEVACGDTLLLADYDVEVFVDGVSVATDSFPAMINQTININYN